MLASINPKRQLDDTSKQYLKEQGLDSEIESKRSVMELQKQQNEELSQQLSQDEEQKAQNDAMKFMEQIHNSEIDPWALVIKLCVLALVVGLVRYVLRDW